MAHWEAAKFTGAWNPAGEMEIGNRCDHRHRTFDTAHECARQQEADGFHEWQAHFSGTPLELRAYRMLLDNESTISPGRIRKLAAVLAAHPSPKLEYCSDEKTGTRYGNAKCRRGRAAKIGYSSHKYQLWAVWA